MAEKASNGTISRAPGRDTPIDDARGGMWAFRESLCSVLPANLRDVGAPLPHFSARGNGEDTALDFLSFPFSSGFGSRIFGSSCIQQDFQGAGWDLPGTMEKGSRASPWDPPEYSFRGIRAEGTRVAENVGVGTLPWRDRPDSERLGRGGLLSRRSLGHSLQRAS